MRLSPSRHGFTTTLLATLLAGASGSALATTMDTRIPLGDVQSGSADFSSSNSGGTPSTGIDINSLTGATRFYSAGFNGGNATLANVEAGLIWNGHETLGHATTQIVGTGASGEVDRHATWVGHVLGGRETAPGNYYQQGMAPDAALWSAAIATGWTGSPYATGFSTTNAAMASAYATVTTTGVAGKTADVFNSSWGFTGPTGFNVPTVGVDGLINDSGVVGVFSAGNSGPGANTVGGIGAGYNGITVGALGSDTSSPAYDSPSSFSSRSPNDFVMATDPVNGNLIPGVRAAVDIAAPGQNLTLAYYGGQTGGNGAGLGAPNGPAGTPSSYSSNVAGTSFAAPTVAGGAALVVDAGYALYGGGNAIDGRVIKSVLMNGARKTTGWNNGQTNVGGVITTTQSLDWAVGAGALDLNRTFDQYVAVANGGKAGTTDVAGLGSGDLGNVAAIGWDYGQVNALGTNTYYIGNQLQAGTSFNATLTWFVDRFAGSTADFTGVSEEHFADLNLTIFMFDDLINRSVTDVVAQSISLYNTSELLSFDLTQTGYYGISVSYDQALWNFIGATNEQYGLSWWGTSVPLPPSLLLLLPGLAILLVRRRGVRLH